MLSRILLLSSTLALIHVPAHASPVDAPLVLIDTNGEAIATLDAEEAEPFSEGLARVKIGGHWGFVNETAHVVIAPTLAYVGDFHEGRAAAQKKKDGGWGFIDRTGRW